MILRINPETRRLSGVKISALAAAAGYSSPYVSEMVHGIRKVTPRLREVWKRLRVEELATANARQRLLRSSRPRDRLVAVMSEFARGADAEEERNHGART